MSKNKILNKFDHRLQYINPQIVNTLAEIDEIKGEFKASFKMTPQAVTNLKKSTLITSTGASTRIEGSKLSDKEIEKIMRGLTISKFANRDFQEVQGYLEVLQNIFNNHQNLTLKESLITSLHNQLLKYSTKDDTHRGAYKKKENTVGVLGPDGKIVKIMFKTTPVFLTGKEMQELVKWTNNAFEKNRFHHLLIIANFIIEFLKIHPFEDGNGRLSRILTNLLLLKSGYQFTQYVSHEQLIEQRKDEYYIALRQSQETFQTKQDNILSWLIFFLSIIKEQATRALSYLNKEEAEDILSPKQYEVWQYLISTNKGVGPSEIFKATGIALGTVRQALNRLLELDKVKRIGRGRGTRYIQTLNH